MSNTIDPALELGGDSAQLIIRVGTWIDEAEGRAMPVVLEATAFPGHEDAIRVFVRGTVTALQDAEFNPWAHNFQVRAFYGGASAESWGLVVHIAPLVQDVLSDENVRLIAGALLGAILGNLLKMPSWLERSATPLTLSEASQRALEYVVMRDGIAPHDAEEISATQLEDMTFDIVIRRRTDNQLLLCKIDSLGTVIARANLYELAQYYERTFQHQEDAAPEAQDS